MLEDGKCYEENEISKGKESVEEVSVFNKVIMEGFNDVKLERTSKRYQLCQYLGRVFRQRRKYMQRSSSRRMPFRAYSRTTMKPVG